MKLLLVVAYFLSINYLQANEEKYKIENSDLLILNNNSIKVKKANINYTYDNAVIEIGKKLDMNSVNGFFHAKNIRDINNDKISTKTINTIRERLINKVIKDKSIFNYLIGYHDEIPPTATLIKSKTTTNKKFQEIHLTGRYEQDIKAICGLDSNRNGLVLLTNGRGGDIYGMFGLKNLDYSNNSALKYFEKIDINVCAIQSYRRADIALKRYGVSGKGVDITNITDFIEWITNAHAYTNFPILVGGVSNGGHLAEYVGVIEKKVQGVLSIGSAIRYDYPNSIYSKVSLSPNQVLFQDPNYTTFNFLFRGENIYKLIYPKALLISFGTHDAGYRYSSTSRKYDKIPQLINVKNLYKNSNLTECFASNVFFGGHAMEPEGEIVQIKKLIKNCFSKTTP